MCWNAPYPSIVSIYLMASDVYSCGDKLLIFITMMLYEYFILCRMLVLPKAKLSVQYFNFASKYEFQIIDTRMLINTSL